jgi:hypothetical protein
MFLLTTSLKVITDDANILMKLLLKVSMIEISSVTLRGRASPWCESCAQPYASQETTVPKELLAIINPHNKTNGDDNYHIIHILWYVKRESCHRWRLLIWGNLCIVYDGWSFRLLLTALRQEVACSAFRQSSIVNECNLFPWALAGG